MKGNNVGVLSCILMVVLLDVVHGWASSSSASSKDRRSFLVQSIGWGATSMVAATTVLRPLPVWAMASVSVSEFDELLRDASKSIRVVELTGPKSETVIVTLVDGTQFRLSDVVESSTDPRSPLKVVATCRSYGVQTSFPDLNKSLAGTKNRKLYRNAQVQKAAELEEEKRKRMEQDEQDRLKQLYQLQQQQPIDES